MSCTDEEPCGSSTCDFCNPGWEYEDDNYYDDWDALEDSDL